MNTIAHRIIAFNASLNFTGSLPEGVGIMNPFRENQGALDASSQFYRKYFNDNDPRYIILGINPGRFGAGLTGVPFTDPKRLESECHIKCYCGPSAHEPSSVFVYDVINQYGGPEAFYSKFYINSICPLGFTTISAKGKEVNYNYYDKAELAKAVRPFMVKCLEEQLTFNIVRDVCFVMGTGKNFQHIAALNKEYGFFKEVIALEHPRYVIQYKSKNMQFYIDKYLEHFRALP